MLAYKVNYRLKRSGPKIQFRVPNTSLVYIQQKQRLDINCVQIERCHLLGFPVFGHVHTRLIEAPHSVELSRKFHPPQKCV